MPEIITAAESDPLLMTLRCLQQWIIAELLYRRLLSSSGETQSSVVLALL
jgi:hypothetical protein